MLSIWIGRAGSGKSRRVLSEIAARRAQRGQAAGRSPDPGGSGAAQQKPGREADRQGRQEPAPLPGRHSVRSAPASATETSRKTARASRSSSPGAWAG